MPSMLLFQMHNSVIQLINSLKHMGLTTLQVTLPIFWSDKPDVIVVHSICSTKNIHWITQLHVQH